MLELCRAIRRDGRFQLRLVASGQAHIMHSEAGEGSLNFTLDDGRDHIEVDENPAELLDGAKKVLADLEPDIVITSLSSFGSGIDEALLATCQVPSFALQDFWGDVNLTLGTPAELYFVRDEWAAKISKELWGVDSYSVGSPKHWGYAGQDVVAMRNAARASLDVKDPQPLIGFFGQSPAMPGHEETYHDLIQAAAALDAKPTLLIRAHPKFQESREKYISQAEGAGLAVIDVTGRNPGEPWLAACDVVTTPFSTSALDHAHLSANSPCPIGSVIYVLTNEDIRSTFLSSNGFTEFPTVTQGIGVVATQPGDLASLLQHGLSDQGAQKYFQASKSLLQEEDPCRLIIEKISERILV